MRLLRGMLAGLAIGALAGLVCILAFFFAPRSEPLELEGGGLQLFFLYCIAALFMAGCGIFGGFIGLVVTIAEPGLPDGPERLTADGRTEKACPPHGKTALPYDDDFG